MFRSKGLFFSIFLFALGFFFGPQPAWCVDIYGGMPAALDQPHINVLLKTTPNGIPIEDFYGFTIDAYLDTGASGIMLSQQTTFLLGLEPQLDRYPANTGPLIVYQDVGVGGSQDFNVTKSLYMGIAKYHPDVDGLSTQPFSQTVGPVRLQITPVDNETTGPLDVVGMPAMMGKVVVIDPKPVEMIFDSMRSYIYNPGTPYNPAAADSEPGIPTTNHHVRLSYASFDQFTNVLPAGAAGPTLAVNPFIGPNPVTGGSTDTPGVTIGFDGSKTTGSFLLDTGAAASMISTAMAGNIHVRYQPGTQGTDNPVLERLDPQTSQWTAIEDQFTSQIGGVGGIVTVAGFFLDSMLIRTTEGNAANDADPNHFNFRQAPVLVNDISLEDPITHRTLTLDGIFGVNNFGTNALVIPGPIPAFGGITYGNFNWAVFDQPNGLLGLDLKAPVSTWNGNGSDELYSLIFPGVETNWSNTINWAGMSPNPTTELVFSQTSPTSTSNFNDFPDGTVFNGITFTGSSVFTLQGNRVALTGDVINNSTHVQTIALDLETAGVTLTFAAITADIMVSGNIIGDQGIIKMGDQKLILKAANTYAGNTTITEGTLTLDGGDLADASAISISTGATLEILSGTPTLGDISGQGTVLVSGIGTTLTARSIIADTLTIGSAANAVPEPSMLVLLGIGLAMFIWSRRRSR